VLPPLRQVSNLRAAPRVFLADTTTSGRESTMLRITRRGVRHLRRNAVAYTALTIALGGTSYAATELPRNSVGGSQIRADAVRSSDVKDGALRLRDFRAGELPAPADEKKLPAVRVEDDTQVELDSAGFALLDLDDEVFDTAKMHPAGGKDDRIRVPRSGTYVLNGEVEWEPNGSGYRKLDLYQLNGGLKVLGSSLVQPRDSTVQSTVQQVTTLVRMREGDTIGLAAGQGSGERLELVRATLSAAFLGR
jgi:hypothetical protein